MNAGVGDIIPIGSSPIDDSVNRNTRDNSNLSLDVITEKSIILLKACQYEQMLRSKQRVTRRVIGYRESKLYILLEIDDLFTECLSQLCVYFLVAGRRILSGGLH